MAHSIITDNGTPSKLCFTPAPSTNNLPSLPTPAPSPSRTQTGPPPALRPKTDLDDNPASKAIPKYDYPEVTSSSKGKLCRLEANYRKSPFPTLLRPSPEECRNVIELLETEHDSKRREELVDMPGAGCGDCPDVLDAIIRTILSQNTTGTSSDKVKEALDAKYGRQILRTVHGPPSEAEKPSTRLNYVAILRGGLPLLKSVMRFGGLVKKAGWIMSILEWLGGEELKAGIKEEDITLDLQWLQLIEDEQEIFNWLVRFTGISFKTASCVILYNMKRSSFAVDTHVNRIATSLGWLPHNTPDEQALFHLDAQTPDEFKFPLHHLFVAHGRQCKKCCGNKLGGTQRIENCPLEGIVKRLGKGEVGGGKKKRTQKKQAEAEIKEEEEDFNAAKVEEYEADGIVEDDEVDRTPSTRAGRSSSLSTPTSARHTLPGSLPTPSPTPMRQRDRVTSPQLKRVPKKAAEEAQLPVEEIEDDSSPLGHGRKRLFRSAAPDLGVKVGEGEGGVAVMGKEKKRRLSPPQFWLEIPVWAGDCESVLGNDLFGE